MILLHNRKQFKYLCIANKHSILITVEKLYRICVCDLFTTVRRFFFLPCPLILSLVDTFAVFSSRSYSPTPLPKWGEGRNRLSQEPRRGEGGVRAGQGDKRNRKRMPPSQKSCHLTRLLLYCCCPPPFSKGKPGPVLFLFIAGSTHSTAFVLVAGKQADKVCP